ncbi:MAG: flippase [bacterium]
MITRQRTGKLSQLPTGKRIVKNFLSLTVAQFIGNILGFVTTAYLARVFCARGFGQISFAQAVIVYFTLLTDFGLNTLGTREVARDKEKIKGYVSNILTIQITLAAASFTLLLVFLALINKPMDYKVLIALFGLSLFSSAFSIDWAFRGIERMEFIGIAQIMRSAIYTGLVFLFIKSRSDIFDVPLFNFIAFLTIDAFLIYSFVRNYGRLSPSFHIRTWKELLVKAFPMCFSYLMIMIYYHMDTIMLGFMKGDEVVGWYNAAYKIILLLLGLLGTFFQVLHPVVSYRHKHRQDELGRDLCLVMKYIILATVPVVFGGMAVADTLLTLLFGGDFQNGSLAFKILIWNIGIVGISSVYGQLILLMGAGERDFAIGVTIGGIVNIILNFLLIPKWSLYGAAVATVTSEIAVAVYVYRASSKTMKVAWARFMYKPMIASIIMFVVLIQLKHLHLFVLLPAGIITYGTFLLMLRGIGKKDLAFIRDFFFAR